MPKIQGMQGDVYFEASNDLPDWRNEPHSDEEDATDDERAAVIAVLGFDPREMSQSSDDEGEQPEESKSGRTEGTYPSKSEKWRWTTIDGESNHEG